jgi:hypothetical protein
MMHMQMGMDMGVGGAGLRLVSAQTIASRAVLYQSPDRASNRQAQEDE